MASSKSLRKGQFPTSCKLCEVETKISWKCMDCDILMCNRCKERIHPNLRNARNHHVIDIKEIGPDTAEVDFSHIPCKDHENQICVMFCMSCDKLVCTQCIANVHYGHGFVEISEGYQSRIQRLKDGQVEIKIKTDKLAKYQSKLKDIKKAENTKFMETKKKIQAHNIALKKEVDRYSENLLKELDQKWDTLLNSIEKEESKAEKNKMGINIRVEEIINLKDAERIFEISDKLETSLEDAETSLMLTFTTMPIFTSGEISQYNVGSLQNILSDISLEIIKEYTTDISEVFYMSPCVDSLWISNYKVVQEVQPEVNNLRVISKFNTEIIGMAETPSNELLLAVRGQQVLKQINVSTHELTDTNYRVDGQVFTAVHVTSDYKVIVGVMDSRPRRRAVIMMDKKGKHKTIYEYDKNNQPLFEYLENITRTHNGNICVVDKLTPDARGRVVVLGQKGDILNIYAGHPDINSDDKPFRPISIVTTPSDNLIVPNLGIGVLHILNNMGQLITHIKTRDIGIQYPYIISFTTTGKVYIGCSSFDKAKLYEVKLSGC